MAATIIDTASSSSDAPLSLLPTCKPTNIDIDAWKFCFSLFDTNTTGVIPTNCIGLIIRAMHCNLTEQQLYTYINTYTENDICDFQTFMRIINTHFHEFTTPIDVDAILSAFQSFDTYHQHTLSAPLLVSILRERGEPLTQNDVDALLCEITIDGDNQVNIPEFIEYMCRSSNYIESSDGKYEAANSQ